MIPMTNIARIAAVIAAFVGGFIVEFAATHGLTLDPEEVNVVVTGGMLAIYALVHRLVSRKSNPTDVASPEIRRAVAKDTAEYRAQKYNRAE